MIREELKALKTGPRELRRFGLSVGGVFLLLGAWFLYRHRPWSPYLVAPGALLLALGALAPRSLKAVYVGWMALAFTLGMIVSTLLLTLCFYAVVTPVGWLARLCGKDFLQQKWDPRAASYWMPRPVAPQQRTDYERQF